MYEIKFKHIVNSYPKPQITQQQDNSYNGFIEESDDEVPEEKSKGVPLAIKNAWGKITDEKYLKYIENPSWLDFSTNVCSECFLKFTEK